MARYVVERTFPDGLAIPADEEGARQCLGVVERNADEGVTWLHSYVSADRTKTFCLYDGPTPEAIRKTAVRNELPIDRITQVRVLDPYFYVGTKEDCDDAFSPVREACCRLCAAALLILGLVVVALLFSSPAGAQTSSCADPVTSAPTGRATVSAASTPSYGKVLIVGSGDYAGCSLYLLTSDQLHALSGRVCVQRQRERPRGAVRHRPLAGAPHRGRPDRGAGGQPHPRSGR